MFDEPTMLQRWLDGAAALDSAVLDALLDPTAYTWLAGRFVDRVVHEARRLTAER